MLRFISLLAALAVWSFGLCQSSSRLNAALPIDIHVKAVDWQPLGKALIYCRDTEAGLGIGAYAPGRFEGKVLLDLKKEDTYEVTWCSMEPTAVVVVRSPMQSRVQICIYLVNAEAQTSKKVFQETFASGSAPTVEVNPSPKLRHAIVTFRSSGQIRHYILCVGRDDLVSVPDLDREIESGTPEPMWSLDGTAIYCLVKVKRNSANQTVSIERGGKTIEIKVPDSPSFGSPSEHIVTSQSVVLGGTVLTFVMRGSEMRATGISTIGTTVLELMPMNAVLRQVRFRGFWNSDEQDKQNLVEVRQPVLLHFEKSNSQDISVWIKEDGKPGARANLVAVHASQTWLAPRDTGIAYIIDGALFVTLFANKA